MKTLQITEHVFHTDTLFIFDCSRKEANKYLERRFKIKDILDDDPDTIGSVHKIATEDRGDVFRLVWVQKLDNENLPVVVHEIVHLALWICKDKGLLNQNDEPAAYLTEFYFKRVMAWAKKIKKNGNR